MWIFQVSQTETQTQQNQHTQSTESSKSEGTQAGGTLQQTNTKSSSTSTRPHKEQLHHMLSATKSVDYSDMDMVNKYWIILTITGVGTYFIKYIHYIIVIVCDRWEKQKCVQLIITTSSTITSITEDPSQRALKIWTHRTAWVWIVTRWREC